MKQIILPVVAAIAVAITFMAARPLETELAPTGYKIGDQATDFKLKNVDEKMVSLADYNAAKGFIVIFTCNECPYAKAYEDRIIALDNKYKSKGYPVVAINPNDPIQQPSDNLAAMQKRAKDKKFPFPYLVDEGQEIYPQYGALRTPHVFVLQKNSGKNLVKYIGAIDNNHEDANDVTEKYVENAVDALLANKNVPKETTVAVGCGIKAKK